MFPNFMVYRAIFPNFMVYRANFPNPKGTGCKKKNQKQDVFVKHNVPLYDVWHCRMTLTLWRMTLTFHHSKCAAPWDTHACQISSCYLQYCKIWPLTLTLKDDLDLSPLKMCSSMRCTCMPNIKLLSSILQKYS